MKMKSSDPEATLRKGSKPSGNDLAAPGNYQAEPVKTKSMSEYAYREAPSEEAVKQAKTETSCVTSARDAYIKASGNHK